MAELIYSTNPATSALSTAAGDSSVVSYGVPDHPHDGVAGNDDSLWDDLRTPLTRATTGSNNPTLTTFVGTTQLYAFSASQLNQLFFDCQLPHTWDAGTGIRPHIHWAPATSNQGTVRWGLEYTIANAVNPPGNVFGVTSGTIYVEQAAGGTPYQHQIAAFPEIDMTGFRLSCVLVCRVFRDAANVADTFTGLAYGVSFDFHVLNASDGSVEEYPAPGGD